MSCFQLGTQLAKESGSSLPVAANAPQAVHFLRYLPLCTSPLPLHISHCR